MIKRAFDLICALLGLLLLSPLLLLVAIAIKLDSPGPVFFRQERIGRHGRPFRIHKLRSMAERQAAQASQITIGADPRITRVGALIRRWKLDELVQLIDVVLGTMSLVGPRPEVARYVRLYPQEVARIVLSVRPGITDPASIHFRNENELLGKSADPEKTYREIILPEKLKLQVAYVKQQSFFGDLVIIVRTIGSIGR
ncbi:sugar transferase [Bordetella genomosp. 12]|uniref:Sugar transferase n=1 Tax=Bordetella genomosp. 12 TaxID=463035 RepID=A0A261VDG3_9BORD|nr:sugar transferase [Bordetella genomosp. 12]OZI72178.1 sugar transferase [Bordetella genomosp. 12]